MHEKFNIFRNFPLDGHLHAPALSWAGLNENLRNEAGIGILEGVRQSLISGAKVNARVHNLAHGLSIDKAWVEVQKGSFRENGYVQNEVGKSRFSVLISNQPWEV